MLGGFANSRDFKSLVASSIERVRTPANCRNEAMYQDIAKFRLVLGICFLMTCSAIAEDSPTKELAEPIKLSFKELRPDGTRPTGLAEQFQQLNGSMIVIRGYMAGSSMSRKTGDRFTLVRDNRAYSPWPVLDNVHVEMGERSVARYTTRPIAIMGTLRVYSDPQPRGRLSSYLLIQDAEILPWVPSSTSRRKVPAHFRDLPDSDD